MAYSVALLEVSKAAFDEIKAKLQEADYTHCFDGDRIDMYGIALVAAGDGRDGNG